MMKRTFLKMSFGQMEIYVYLLLGGVFFKDQFNHKKKKKKIIEIIWKKIFSLTSDLSVFYMLKSMYLRRQYQHVTSIKVYFAVFPLRPSA